MPADFNTAILVMLVGMTTVFVILSLVVLSGQVLIRLVNHFSPEIAVRKSPVSPLLVPTTKEENLSPSIIAAIAAAVENVTGGRGRINTIEKK